jgi:hypothetical protein
MKETGLDSVPVAFVRTKPENEIAHKRNQSGRTATRALSCQSLSVQYFDQPTDNRNVRKIA